MNSKCIPILGADMSVRTILFENWTLSEMATHATVGYIFLSDSVRPNTEYSANLAEYRIWKKRRFLAYFT